MYRPVLRAAVILAALLAMSPALALADDGMPSAEHRSIGLGFHNLDAPVGVRWWFAGQKIGIDLGLGYQSESAIFDDYPDENVTSLALDLGVPIVVKSWPRVHVLFRPGFFYETQQVVDSDGSLPIPEPFATEDIKTMRISGEIEAELFLMDNMSVSASHGIAYESIEFPGVSDKFKTLGTLGNNFTEIGFHIYLWGSTEH